MEIRAGGIANPLGEDQTGALRPMGAGGDVGVVEKP